MYHIVADEKEMEWFFNHVITPPRPEETYMICLSARSKKLTEEERLLYQLGRGEMMRTELIRRKGGNWNFEIYKQGPYKYNCDENAMLTKAGVPYPEKCLVCYAYVNPSDELDCVHDTYQFFNAIEHELLESYKKGSLDGVNDHLEKLPKIFEHLRSCHATNISRRIWRDFDADVDPIDGMTKEDAKKVVYTALVFALNKFYGKGNYVIVETSGGYHSLVKVEAMHSNPNDFIKEVKEQTFSHNGESLKVDSLCKEIVLTKPGSQFLPLPGTLQYGHLVKVVNKLDFKD